MFRNSRRTPSPQTVELIKQLAYVSGGALCGVTALYLEECRRRIQILQRLVDKRRAIVQVLQSRQYSKAAVAVQSAPLEGEYFHGFDQTQSNLDVGTARYEPPTSYTYGNSGGSQSFNAAPWTKRAPLENSGPPEIQSISSRHSIGPDEPIRTRSQKYDKEQRMAPATSRSATEQRGDWQGMSANVLQLQRSDRADQRSIEPVGRSSSANTDQASDSSIPHAVSDRITAFFEGEPQQQDPVSAQVAERLLTHACRHGTLANVRQICVWLLENGRFTIEHGDKVVEACLRLAKTYDPKITCEFLAFLFHLEHYETLDPVGSLRQSLKVLKQALEWNLEDTPSEITYQLLPDRLQSVDVKDKVRLLNSECRPHLADGRLSQAVTLFLHAELRLRNKRDPNHFPGIAAVADKIMSWALKSREFPSYKRLLQWKREHQPPEAFREQLNAFIKACGADKLYPLLTDFATRESANVPLFKLFDLAEDLNKVTLAVAISVSPSSTYTFSDVHQHIPKYLQQKANQRTAVTAIVATWEATHSQDLIENKANELARWLQQTGDEKSLRKLDEALLQIYVLNGKSDQAFAHISRMHKSACDGGVFMALTALYFAKAWSWDQLARFLEMSKQHAPFEFNRRTTKIFNNVIRFYAQDHSLTETWMFIASAIEDLGFAPSNGTTILILNRMLYHKALDLIPRWYAFLRSIGHPFYVRGPLVHSLLRTYWGVSKQPSQHMFQLGYRLWDSMPWIDAKWLDPSMKMAITQDFNQGARGQDAMSIRQGVLARLERKNPMSGSLIDSEDSDSQQNVSVSESDEQTERTNSASRRALEQEESDDLYYKSDNLAHPEVTMDERETIARSGEDSTTRDNNLAQRSGSFLSTKSEIDEMYYESLALADLEPSQDESGMTAEIEEDGTTEEDYTAEQGRTAEEDHIAVKTYHPLELESSPPEQALRSDNEVRRDLEVEGRMALSQGQFQRVLDLEYNSRDDSGLPVSPAVFKNAVKASVRLYKGDTTHAENLIAEAKEKGMNVSRLQDPVLIQKALSMQIDSKEDAEKVVQTTFNYYRENCEGGYQVKFGLAHATANMLIRQGYAHEATRLLSSIFHADFMSRRLPSITTMSVWVKAYGKLHALDGIWWVVNEVLSQNHKIDRIFLGELRHTRSIYLSSYQRRLITSWLRKCEKRREHRDLDDKIFGNQLVDCLVQLANPGDDKRTAGSIDDIPPFETLNDVPKPEPVDREKEEEDGAYQPFS